MVSQSWIIKCLKMYQISDKVIKFIMETIKNWQVELTAGGTTLAEMKIQRGIFSLVGCFTAYQPFSGHLMAN